MGRLFILSSIVCFINTTSHDHRLAEEATRPSSLASPSPSYPNSTGGIKMGTLSTGTDSQRYNPLCFGTSTGPATCNSQDFIWRECI